jgi:hypothetical protein
MGVFDVDFDKLNLELLPTFIRNPLLRAFLQAKTAPVINIWAEFLKIRGDVFFLLKYDTSKRNVEIALQTKFNDVGIFIENAKPAEGSCLDFYLDDYIEESGYITETKTAYIDDLYLDFHMDEEIPTSDFTIHVPELTYLVSAKEIYDFAGYFVLPGFRYLVERY